MVVPSKAMQLRLDRAARDLRLAIERGEGEFQVRVLDVRFWDFGAAFGGVPADLRLSICDLRLLKARSPVSCLLTPDSCLYDWWLSLDPHTRHVLLELVRFEVGETSVSFRPKRKCPYCAKVVRVVDRDRDEWPFLAKHRGRDKPECPGSYHVIDDLTDVRAQPRE